MNGYDNEWARDPRPFKFASLTRSYTKCQKDLDFDSEVDRDVPIAIYTGKYRAGTARSTFPIV